MKFNYMSPNGKILTAVEVDNRTKEVKFTNFTDEITDRVFGVRTEATYEDVIAFFEGRCFPRNRADAKDLLKLLGLKHYDPYRIAKKSHGTSAQDENWIDFLED